MTAVQEILVKKEYGKLNNVKPEDIQALMLWLSQQPHLPYQYITELDVILAYHSCACDLQLTKQVIDLNYTLRTLFSFYQNRKMDKCLEIALETWLISPLPILTKKGYRPIYCEVLDSDPAKFVYSDVVKAFLMVIDMWQYEEGTVPGVAIILNLDRVSLGHISRMNLNVAQQFFYFLQEAMFVCLKEFHFFNTPTFMDTLMGMLKPLMKDDLLDILKIHPVGSNTLEAFISTEELFQCDKISLKDEIVNKIQSNGSFFEEEAMKRVDESKRPGGPKSVTTFFPGFEKSFKKLEID